MHLTNNITVSLGKPITAPALIPVTHASTPCCINERLVVDGEAYEITAISFGTPHGAVFADDLDCIDVQTLGNSLGTNALFPEGASIVFIQMLDEDHLKVKLWKRNKGETDFSLEAACVAGTTAIMLHKVWNSEANISMGGNDFQVKWDRGTDKVSLSGPADLILA